MNCRVDACGEILNLHLYEQCTHFVRVKYKLNVISQWSWDSSTSLFCGYDVGCDLNVCVCVCVCVYSERTLQCKLVWETGTDSSSRGRYTLIVAGPPTVGCGCELIKHIRSTSGYGVGEGVWQGVWGNTGWLMLGQTWVRIRIASKTVWSRFGKV